MRATDLDLRELLSFDPKGGVIRFGGERVVLFDAVALGILRKELIDNLGVADGARHPHAHRLRARLADGGEPPVRVPVGERAGVADRRGPAPHAARHSSSSSRPAPPAPAGREPFVHNDLARVLRGRAAPAAPRPGRGAGVLDVDGLRERLPLLRNGREVYCIEDRCRGKGDADLQPGGALQGGVGPGDRAPSALLRQGVHRRGAGRGDRRRCAMPRSACAPGGRSSPGSRPAPRSARAWWCAARRCAASSTWRAGSPRSSPPRSSPARAASGRSASPGSSTTSRPAPARPFVGGELRRRHRDAAGERALRPRPRRLHRRRSRERPGLFEAAERRHPLPRRDRRDHRRACR